MTVYRLVACNTDVEKVLALHERKRVLADALIEGADSTLRTCVSIDSRGQRIRAHVAG